MDYKACYLYNLTLIEKLKAIKERLEDEDLCAIVNNSFPHIEDGKELFLTPSGALTPRIEDADLSFNASSPLVLDYKQYTPVSIDCIVDWRIEEIQAENQVYIDNVMFS